jgi:hypothetical protein
VATPVMAGAVRRANLKNLRRLEEIIERPALR